MDGINTITRQKSSANHSITNKYLKICLSLLIVSAFATLILGVVLNFPIFIALGLFASSNSLMVFLLYRANIRLSYTPDLQYDYGDGKYKDLSILSRISVYSISLLYFIGMLINYSIQYSEGNSNFQVFNNKLELSIVYVLLLTVVFFKNFALNKYYNASHQEIFRKQLLKSNLLQTEEFAMIIFSMFTLSMQDAFDINPVILQLGISALFFLYLLIPLLKNASAAFDNLLDRNLPEPILYDFLSLVLDNQHKDFEYQSMRTRRSGDNIFIEIDILMPGESTIGEAFNLENKILTELKSKYPNAVPRIYITPKKTKSIPVDNDK